MDLKNHHPDEATIIKRILDGEKEFYELLVRRNNQRLYRTIRSYLKVEAEVEDVMQDTYIKAYKHLNQFNQDASFSTWLIRIGINEALALLNKQKRLQSLKKHLDDIESNTILELPDNLQPNPQDSMIQNETKHLLEKAIDQLGRKYRIVYIMREVEDMSLEEIANALDLTVANVKVRLHRSRKMLREKLYNFLVDSNVFEFGFNRCDKITENVMNNI